MVSDPIPPGENTLEIVLVSPEKYTFPISCSGYHSDQKHWKKGVEEFQFHRDEMIDAAKITGVERPDNLGDVIYSFKFRRELPKAIAETAPKGKSWMLEGAGHGLYRFRLVKTGGTTIKPRSDIAAIKIPDATPEIIG